MPTNEILEIANKRFCNLEDLKILSGYGTNNAIKLRKELKNKLISEGYFVPKNLLPMDKVIKYLNINLDYYKKLI